MIIIDLLPLTVHLRNSTPRHIALQKFVHFSQYRWAAPAFAFRICTRVEQVCSLRVSTGTPRYSSKGRSQVCCGNTLIYALRTLIISLMLYGMDSPRYKMKKKQRLDRTGEVGMHRPVHTYVRSCANPVKENGWLRQAYATTTCFSGKTPGTSQSP